MGYEAIPERIMIKISKNYGWQSKENVIKIKNIFITLSIMWHYGLVGDDQFGLEI
jgi:hypothetical protein